MIAALVMVCAPVVGLRVPSSTAVLHGHLITLLAQPARSFARALVATPCQSVPLLLRPINLMVLATCGSDLKNKNYRAG